MSDAEAAIVVWGLIFLILGVTIFFLVRRRRRRPPDPVPRRNFFADLWWKNVQRRAEKRRMERKLKKRVNFIRIPDASKAFHELEVANITEFELWLLEHCYGRFRVVYDRTEPVVAKMVFVRDADAVFVRTRLGDLCEPKMLSYDDAIRLMQ